MTSVVVMLTSVLCASSSSSQPQLRFGFFANHCGHLVFPCSFDMHSRHACTNRHLLASSVHPLNELYGPHLSSFAGRVAVLVRVELRSRCRDDEEDEEEDDEEVG
jgi:hypothetical protein